MHRRSFLQLLGVGAAGLAVEALKPEPFIFDPHANLWRSRDWSEWELMDYGRARRRWRLEGNFYVTEWENLVPTPPINFDLPKYGGVRLINWEDLTSPTP